MVESNEKRRTTTKLIVGDPISWDKARMKMEMMFYELMEWFKVINTITGHKKEFIS